MDLLRNFDAQRGDDAVDSLVAQLRNDERRVVFYGDDTWLRLYGAGAFVRAEGTTSFFVQDTVEVDRNVTRNALLELERVDDWDVMFLHYLGLDHIGHWQVSFQHSFSFVLRRSFLFQEKNTLTWWSNN